MTVKGIVKYYEFECGCLVAKEDAKKMHCMVNGKRSTRLLCEKHKKKVRRVHLICDKCGKTFTHKTATSLYCPPCKKEVTQENTRRATAMKRHPDRVYIPYVTGIRKAKPAPKPPDPRIIKHGKQKAFLDNSCGALCKHRNECLSAQLFHGIKFNCQGCKEYEKIDFLDCIMASGPGNLTKAQEYWGDKRIS